MQSKSSNALLLLLHLPTVLVILPVMVMFGATIYANYQVHHRSKAGYMFVPEKIYPTSSTTLFSTLTKSK